MRLWRRLTGSTGRGGKQVPEGVRVPEQLGDLWHILQDVAREDDPRFEKVNIVEHATSSAEALKDVDRWLHMYRRRLDPEHEHSFPPHHRRHRGYCLMARNWPDGISWDAFDDRTLARAPIPPQRGVEQLVSRLDALIDGAGEQRSDATT